VYEVNTIGDLPGLRGQAWPDPAPDWVRPPAAALPSGRAELAPTAGTSTVNGYAVAGVVLAGVLVGALGLVAWDRWGK
jgi:hypothetical protein